MSTFFWGFLTGCITTIVVSVSIVLLLVWSAKVCNYKDKEINDAV